MVLSVISEVYRKGQRWLIYCDDQDQLNDVLERLRLAGYDPLEYHSSMTGGKHESLSWFIKMGGLLVAIKCLDEGIDIPSVTHALILASSQNPREFIQRRGRVLRVDPTNPLKTMAFIHDIIVVPPPSDEEDILSIFKSELKRAAIFSDTALNPTSIDDILRIASDLGLSLENILESFDNGVENDD